VPIWLNWGVAVSPTDQTWPDRFAPCDLGSARRPGALFLQRLRLSQVRGFSVGVRNAVTDRRLTWAGSKRFTRNGRSLVSFDHICVSASHAALEATPTARGVLWPWARNNHFVVTPPPCFDDRASPRRARTRSRAPAVAGRRRRRMQTPKSMEVLGSPAV
jgi:hypothetical protein